MSARSDAVLEPGAEWIGLLLRQEGDGDPIVARLDANVDLVVRGGSPFLHAATGPRANDQALEWRPDGRPRSGNGIRGSRHGAMAAPFAGAPSHEVRRRPDRSRGRPCRPHLPNVPIHALGCRGVAHDIHTQEQCDPASTARELTRLADGPTWTACSDRASPVNSGRKSAPTVWRSMVG